MNYVLELIRQHGDLFYLWTFLWTALEGETFVIFAGLFAQRGLLNIEALFLAAWLGSLCGDQIFFFLGRYGGTRLVARFPKIQPKLDKVLDLLTRYATVFILSYRFMYGIRNVSGIAVGMSHLTWHRFAILNAIASFVWALVFCGAGYLFGDVIERFSGGEDGAVANEAHILSFAALGLIALLVLVRFFVVRLQNKKIGLAKSEK